MTSPISPTASPEEWTKWLAAALRDCLEGASSGDLEHYFDEEWTLNDGNVHVSVIRDWIHREWIGQIAPNRYGLSTTGRAALDALEGKTDDK